MEIMISSAVMLMMLGLAVSAFAQYSQYVHRVSGRAQLQQDSIFIINHLTRDLTETNGNRIYSPPSSNAIIFAQPRELDGELSPPTPDGDLSWGRLVCYRIDASGSGGQMLRQMDGLADLPKPPDVLTMPVPHDLAYFQGAAGLATRAFHGEATALVVERESTPPFAIKNPLRLTLTMRVTVGDQVMELDNSTHVQPRH